MLPSCFRATFHTTTKPCINPGQKKFLTSLKVSSHSINALENAQTFINLSPTRKPSSSRQAKKKKRVTFRDQVVKGSQIADVYIVSKIVYKRDDEDDEAQFSCACRIF